jgi:hypothetical protein
LEFTGKSQKHWNENRWGGGFISRTVGLIGMVSSEMSKITEMKISWGDGCIYFFSAMWRVNRAFSFSFDPSATELHKYHIACTGHVKTMAAGKTSTSLPLLRPFSCVLQVDLVLVNI